MNWSRFRRVSAIGLLMLMAMAALGARCIEHDSSYVDTQGYTHVVGEMVNDTDVSASTVTLRAQLLDPQGTVLAETTGILCPETVQPKTRNTFDLRFPTPNLGAFDHYEVRPIDGKTIPTTLPDSGVTVANLEVKRFGIDTAVRGDLMSTAKTTYNALSMCVAFYDASGRVVRVFSAVVAGPLNPGTRLHFGNSMILEVPTAAVSAGLWLVPASTARWVTSGP